MHCYRVCSKPVKQGELLARISAQLRVKADATWVQSIVKGVLEDDSEAMNILQTILPEPIISRIQVALMLLHCSLSIARSKLDLLVRAQYVIFR